MIARALRGVSQHQLDMLSNDLSLALEGWLKDWLFLEQRVVIDACVAVEEQVFEDWIVGVDHWQWRGWDQDGVRIAMPTDALMRLGQNTGLLTMSALADECGIGEHILEQAWQDAMKRLASILQVVDAAPSSLQNPMPELLVPFSGAVMAHMVCAEVPLIVTISGAKFAKLYVPTMPSNEHGKALQQIVHALSPLAVPIECSLKPLSIELGILTSLAVGDVLVLEQLLHEPLYVTSIDGDSVCCAFLGKCGTSLALELTSNMPLAAANRQ